MFQPDTDSRGNTVKEQTPPFELVQYTTGPLQKISSTKLLFWRNSLKKKWTLLYLFIYLFVVLQLKSHQQHFFNLSVAQTWHFLTPCFPRLIV